MPAPWVGAAGFGAVTPLEVDPTWLAADDADSDADVRGLAHTAGVADSEIVAVAGDPVTCICAAADEYDADVIVVGSHDKTALRRLVDPSVAAGVVRSIHRPVLVVSGRPPS